MSRLMMVAVAAIVLLMMMMSADAARTQSETEHAFTAFMMQYGKKYESASEMFERFAIFRANVADIEAHNARPGVTFTKGINQFADMRMTEVTKYLNLQRPAVNPWAGVPTVIAPQSTAHTTADSFDWRSKKLVTPVGNEGQCGSTWAWAPVTSLETTWAIAKGTLVELSVQQVANCANPSAGGCNGGDPNLAFTYSLSSGLCTAKDYPYKPSDEPCRASACTPVARWTSMATTPLNETAMLKSVLVAPLSVAIRAGCQSFISYTGGILDDPSCGTDVDHACTIVGFGTENGVDYWSLKNMWDTTWGENGYIRIVRNKNQGGIISDLGYPPTYALV